MRKWLNCPITHSDVKISKEFKVSTDSIHSGVDIEYNGKVHSICEGVVIFKSSPVNSKDNCIVIQYNKYICIRMSNLTQIDVNFGDAIPRNTVIGHCEGFLHFEYLTIYDIYPSIPSVKIGYQTYYRNAPQLIIDGSVLLFDSNVSQREENE